MLRAGLPRGVPRDAAPGARLRALSPRPGRGLRRGHRRLPVRRRDVPRRAGAGAAETDRGRGSDGADRSRGRRVPVHLHRHDPRPAAEGIRHQRGAWHPSATDEVLANPASAEAARQFRDEQIARGQWLADSPEHSGAYAESERVLEEFGATIEAAADDEELSRRLALADTTVDVRAGRRARPVDHAAARPHPDRGAPTAATRKRRSRCGSPASTSSTCAPGTSSCAMAIARGRVGASGPVRKFLRVVPIARAAGRPSTSRAGRDSANRARTGDGSRYDDVRRRRGSSTRAAGSAPSSAACSTRRPTTSTTRARWPSRSHTPATSGRSSASTSTRRSGATACSTGSTSASPRG